MPDLRTRIAAALGGPLARERDSGDRAVSDAWFARGVCCNCGTALATPYCGACGQKAARRFVWRDLRTEGWDRLRLFEMTWARTLVRLVLAPGLVARGYVLGCRADTMHPLKLLVATVAILVVVLAGSQYFSVYAAGGNDAVVARMAAQVLAWSNWSFSLGIVAIIAAARLTFGRRLGYNLVEVGVLAVYCQAIVLAFIAINLLPTLIRPDPAFVLAHKAASQVYVPIVKTLVVAVGYRQFYRLSWRADAPRLALACLIFTALNWALLRLYAAAILLLVDG